MSANIEAGNYPNHDDYTDDIEFVINDQQSGLDDVDEIDVDMVMPQKKEAAQEVAAEHNSGKTGKKKLTKNQLALYVVIGVVVLFALLLFLQMPSTPSTPAAKKSGGFQATEVNETVAAPVKAEVILELEQEIVDLRNELKSTRASANEAFESIAVTIKNLQESNREIVAQVVEIKTSYDELLSNGNNKFVDQSKKLNAIQSEFRAGLAKVTQELKAFKEEQNNKLDISKRKQYEVISVVAGKALIREIESGKELKIQKGTELNGFGAISDIAITGCITFDSGERYTPIKGRCL
ncbi:coiled-coil domain-containing protein 22 [Shewanella aestuarii]|uniref:Coiled-coil domain-containing protein 22 n=1 Tax=Shewanella aestuarii TaxID=1028752 RepID=A0A6G9QPK1_9GAMM|nr:coiled-coil domain-containing protein 22 [Shewanella aestuarii]QIR16520.1 coiled-coil domain-containing protein 22 [Shewanella aestuarii]